jgi:PIN domain nuclease of toxin-antitoxin system
MKLLLDTHVFLWWVADDERLPASTRRLIGTGSNEAFVSSVSAWEIVLNASRGRIELPDPPERFVPRQLRENAFEPLPLTMSHALATSRLPEIHGDPFDRLLVAQAVVEDFALVTADEQIAKYPVKIRW